MDDAAFERYSRHINLDRIGFDGQLRLSQSHAVLIGAGGLGCPAALYLAAAGVGTLTVVDDDTIELSNLQRQIAHTTARVGDAKAESLCDAATAINPTVTFNAVTARAGDTNLHELIKTADVVLDGSDNLATRQSVNAACAAHRAPLVTASAVRFDGQLAVLHPGATGRACYRCLYPETLSGRETCQSAGVIGPLVGVLGSYMALEAVKQLIGIGDASVDTLWLFDGLQNHWQPLRIAAKPNCPVCGSTQQPQP